MNVYNVHGKTHGIVKKAVSKLFVYLRFVYPGIFRCRWVNNLGQIQIKPWNIVPKKNIVIFLRFTTLYSKEERALWVVQFTIKDKISKSFNVFKIGLRSIEKIRKDAQKPNVFFQWSNHWERGGVEPRAIKKNFFFIRWKNGWKKCMNYGLKRGLGYLDLSCLSTKQNHFFCAVFPNMLVIAPQSPQSGRINEY